MRHHRPLIPALIAAVGLLFLGRETQVSAQIFPTFRFERCAEATLFFGFMTTPSVQAVLPKGLTAYVTPMNNSRIWIETFVCDSIQVGDGPSRSGGVAFVIPSIQPPNAPPSELHFSVLSALTSVPELNDALKAVGANSQQVNRIVIDRTEPNQFSLRVEGGESPFHGIRCWHKQG